MNRLPRLIITTMALLCFGATIHAGDAGAQSWPTRPLKFIVSSAAGGAPDIICRIIGERLSVALGQPIVIENRPGGGNIAGAQAAAHALPDGYTFFFATSAALVTNPYAFKSLPYDPLNDFVPISMIAKNPFILLAHPSVPASTLAELIAVDKADPGKLGFATDGPRNFSGILAAWINKLAGTSILQVPYATMPQGVQDTVAGRLQLVILAPAAAAPFMSQGQLHPLAVSSINRAPRYQSVPSIAETFPGVELIGWFALIGPKGTGSDVVQGLNRALDRVLNEPDLVRKLTDLGFYTEGAGTPEATRDYIRAQHAMWGKVAYDIGLEPQ